MKAKARFSRPRFLPSTLTIQWKQQQQSPTSYRTLAKIFSFVVHISLLLPKNVSL
jgi:hypothetical protein